MNDRALLRVLTILIPMLLFCVVAESYASSTVHEVQFYSVSLDENRVMKVYLPDGYDPGGQDRYPVIYFLHGFSGYESYWQGGFQALLDYVIATQLIHPIIFVTPDGRIFDPPWTGSFWTDSPLYGDLEGYVLDDVVGHIDSTYKTIPEPAARVLMGHSMGGYGAMKIALKHQHAYRAVVSSSGVLYTRMAAVQDTVFIIGEAQAHGWPEPPYEYHPWPGTRTLTNFARCGAFSPNLASTPYPVDFFLDEWGAMIDSVMAQWRLNDPPYLAAQVQQNPAMDVLFECGTYLGDIEWMIHEQNMAFADSLGDLGWEYRFRVYPGADHNTSLAYRLPDDFAYIDSLLFQPTALADDGAAGSSANHVLRLSPNPAFGSTEVTLALPADDWVSLAVYDIQGRLVRRLLGDQMSAGQHRCRWEVRDETGSPVARGVYFIRLSSERGVQARNRVVVVR
jgi:enterochelin esterase-like enzyme